MDYHYRASDAKGHIHHGVLNATSPDELAQRITQMGLWLIAATPQPHRRRLTLRRDNAAQRRLHFAQALDHVLHAGLPLVEGLRCMRRSLRCPQLRSTTDALLLALRQGHTLAAAMRQHPTTFDPIFTHIIQCAERANALPATLNTLAATLAWQAALHKRMRLLMIYPSCVALVLFFAVGFVLWVLVPELADFLRHVSPELPLPTRILLALSDALHQHGARLALGSGVGLLLGHFIWRGLRPRLHTIDRLKLKLWGTGPLYRAHCLARLLRALALLLASGEQLLDALSFAGTVLDNPYMTRALNTARTRIAQGGAITDSLALCGYFPPTVLQLIAIGEHSGNLISALEHASELCERQVRDALDTMQGLLEPILTLSLGSLLVLIILLVLAPIYQAFSQIGG